MTFLLGFLLVTIAGLGTGSIAWPIKVMRRFQFEQWWFIGMVVGLLIMPWGITLSSVPSVFAAYGAVDPRLLIKSNIFAFGWAMQILGNQGVGFISGEWRGVLGAPRDPE